MSLDQMINILVSIIAFFSGVLMSVIILLDNITNTLGKHINDDIHQNSKKRKQQKDEKMTTQEISDALERITDSLSDIENRWGIEGVIKDLNNLRNNINKGWDHKRV